MCMSTQYLVQQYSMYVDGSHKKVQILWRKRSTIHVNIKAILATLFSEHVVSG